MANVFQRCLRQQSRSPNTHSSSHTHTHGHTHRHTQPHRAPHTAITLTWLRQRHIQPDSHWDAQPGTQRHTVPHAPRVTSTYSEVCMLIEGSRAISCTPRDTKESHKHKPTLTVTRAAHFWSHTLATPILRHPTTATHLHTCTPTQDLPPKSPQPHTPLFSWSGAPPTPSPMLTQHTPHTITNNDTGGPGGVQGKSACQACGKTSMFIVTFCWAFLFKPHKPPVKPSHLYSKDEATELTCVK